MTLHCAILFPENTSIGFIIIHWFCMNGLCISRTSKIESANTLHVASHPIPWTLSCPGTIFRIKGILAVKNHPFKHVFHAVMDVSDEADAEPWGKDEKRITKIVFIGALVTGGKRRPAIGNPWIFPGTLAYGILLVTHVISISCYIWCFRDSRHTHTDIYISSISFLVDFWFQIHIHAQKSQEKVSTRHSFENPLMSVLRRLGLKHSTGALKIQLRDDGMMMALQNREAKLILFQDHIILIRTVFSWFVLFLYNYI